MQLAEPLRKKNSPHGERDGGLFFCSAEEGASEFLKRFSAGKALFVTDRSSLSAFRKVDTARAVNLVLDVPDALPLFSMPDETAAVLAAGGESTLRAARYFAEIRRVPAALFPSSSALYGTLERSATVNLGGVSANVELSDGEIYCDLEFMKPTIADGYARLLLSRLALVESRALRLFRMIGESGQEERAFGELIQLEHLSAREVVRKNAVIADCEREGLYAGEGQVLARIYRTDGEWRAFCVLGALYAAFFAKGRPQHTVPDYKARAARAGVPYSAQNIPTPQEYASRAIALDQQRVSFVRELDAISKKFATYRRTFFRFADRILANDGDGLRELKCLPEYSGGLTAVIRDFGLMEWE